MEKSAQIRIWLDFFFTWTVGAAHSLKSVFDRIPVCSSLPNSLLICSRAAKETFFYFLNTGCAQSFTLSLVFNLEHFPWPPEKSWENRCLSSFLRFTELDVALSILRQNLLIRQSHKLIFLSNLLRRSCTNFLVRRLSDFWQLHLVLL